MESYCSKKICLGFSHLFFADDLTLMAKANNKSCQAIKMGLNLFCSLSGQCINHTKFKILFSNNCAPNIIKDITNHTDSFGTYLGFPIITRKRRPVDFQFIIDKIRARLASWKTRFINIACRTTLAQATLNSIPNRYMQYTLRPRKILKQIDKVQRDVIWGTTEEKKKLPHQMVYPLAKKDQYHYSLGKTYYRLLWN